MARLTREQKSYLRRHDIGVEETFDASGLTRAEYRSRMKAEGKFIAFGVTPCLYGHALRTRHGNCIQCSPAAVGFGRRSSLSGYIYCAYSGSAELYKIGFSADDPSNRVYIANLDGYGGATDWRIRFRVWSERAGALEIALHSSLARFRAERQWVRNGAPITSKELFLCGFGDVLDALLDVISDDEAQCIEAM